MTRVPVTLNEAKQAVATIGAQTADRSGQWLSWPLATRELCRVAQRWLLVRSEQASHREQQTLAKTCSKTVPASSKPSPNCVPDALLCEADAQAELSCFTASLMLLQLDAEVVGEPVYTGRGRPKRGEEPTGHQFQITGLAATSLVCVEEARNQTGVFILATNDHSDTLTMAELLATYKAQQNVERGFRFLKSPEFLTSSLYPEKAGAD